MQVWSLSTHTCTHTHITGLLPDLVSCACTALSTSDVTQQQRTHPHPTLFLSCHHLHPHPSTFNVQPSPTFRTRAQEYSAQYRALCCCALILVLASLPSPTISLPPAVSASSSLSRHCHCHHLLHLAIAILPSHDDNDMITAPLQLSCCYHCCLRLGHLSPLSSLPSSPHLASPSHLITTDNLLDVTCSSGVAILLPSLSGLSGLSGPITGESPLFPVFSGLF